MKSKRFDRNPWSKRAPSGVPADEWRTAISLANFGRQNQILYPDGRGMDVETERFLYEEQDLLARFNAGRKA